MLKLIISHIAKETVFIERLLHHWALLTNIFTIINIRFFRLRIDYAGKKSHLIRGSLVYCYQLSIRKGSLHSGHFSSHVIIHIDSNLNLEVRKVQIGSTNLAKYSFPPPPAGKFNYPRIIVDDNQIPTSSDKSRNR